MENTEKRYRILYVEDNPVDIDLTSTHFSLEAPDFEIFIARTGRQFLKMVKENQFDAFLIDNHLPDTLGLDLLKELIKNKIYTPAVMVTGLGDEELVVQALMHGASDYIPKHSDYLEKLPDILRRICNENVSGTLVEGSLVYQRIHVLYVETHPMDIEQTVNYIKQEAPSIEITAVRDVQSAWRIIEQNTEIDLILCDLSLPGISGLEFLHDIKLKKLDIPFIMVTGKGGEEAALAALKLGAYDFISKNRNYIEKLPGLIQNACIRHKLSVSTALMKGKYENLTRSIENIIHERTVELIREIEERKKIESDLRKSEEKYSAFIKQSSEAICLFELEHQPLDINLPVDDQINHLYENAVISELNMTFASAHGYNHPSDMTGFKMGMVFPRLARVNVDYLRNFITNNYNIAGYETKELSKDGSVKYFLNSLTGSIENSMLVRVWGAKQDITRIKQAEEEIRLLNTELENRVKERTADLELAIQELESFTYSVSHDLRAPLRAISGFINIIKEDHNNEVPDSIRQLFERILHNTKKMGNLIDDLLRLSRITKQELRKEKVNLKKLFEDVFNELSVGKKSYVINIETLPEITGDTSLLKIVVENLVANATKFSSIRKKPVITIGSEKKSDSVTVFIKDNGVGFNMKYADKLFQVFQRLHSGNQFEGTGIGLAIVNRIIKKHGGNVWAEGIENKGATFYFSLPLK